MARQGLRSRTLGVLGKTIERLLADDRRAARVARAVGTVQKSKGALDKVQASAMRAMGLASKRDFKEVGKQASALRRRVRHLAEKIEKMA